MAQSMRLTSTAFSDGTTIPSKYTCSGADVSPPLSWSGVPDGTKSLAVTMIDPDAPSKPFVHWLIFDLPASANGLPENVARGKTLQDSSRQGRNDFNVDGYGGPCPPPGPAHHYRFTVYALNTTVAPPGGTREPAFVDVIKGHVLATGTLVGTFGR